jgi:F-type H+-transporting ATPase subunit b
MKRLLLAAFLLTTCGLTAQERPDAAHSEETGDAWIVWKWANFVILAAGLGYLLAKHLPPLFRSRTEEIQKGISESQAMKRDAEKRAAEMDARLSTLGAEIERFRTQAHAEMEQEGARIRQETAKQIEKLQRQAEQEIESAGKAASRELKSYAAQLALDLATQRIQTRLDAATETGLADDFVRDLERQGSQN